MKKMKNNLQSLWKYIAIVVFLFNSTGLYAQFENEKDFLISVDAGKGVMFGKSNLSPWGVNYRKEHQDGFTANLKAFYRMEKCWIIGAKYSLFIASENYEINDGKPTVNDITLNYIAPQIGYRKNVTPYLIFGFAMGAGYLHYGSKSLTDNTEYQFKSSSWGGNFDLTLDYMLFTNFAVGIDASIIGGNKFKKLDQVMNDREETLKPDKWNQIRVLRADFTIGIKVFF